MPRDYEICLQDALEAMGRIARYLSGVSREAFAADEQKIDAVVRNLEVLGEAVKNVPDEVRGSHPQIEWKKIAGLRDILIHQYFGVDLDIIWDIVRNKLPILEEQVAQILKSRADGD
jgi:uncharacterized protein with HEPN domain